jgi:hypothetical protein
MSDIEQRGTEACSVADLLLNGEGLFEVLEGGVVVAAGVIDLGDINEGGAFAGLVTDVGVCSGYV